MRKFLLVTAIALFFASFIHAQCVPSCTNYVTYTVPYAPFPDAGNNAYSLFTPNTDDGYTSPVSIGFNFSYYCTNYSTVLIYTNGMIQFNIGAPSTFPAGYDRAQTFPSPTAPNALVAYRMDDLDPTVGGAVTYTTLGISPNQSFVVTYSNVPLYSNNSLLYSGQIALYESTNMIDIISILTPDSYTLASQGIEDAFGTYGTGVPGRNNLQWAAGTSAYRFAPFEPAPPTSVTGATTLCEGDVSLYTVSSMPGATSYTWNFPTGWTGTNTLSTISSTVGTSGQILVAATYTCGTSAPFAYSVTTIPAPLVSITSASPSILCSGATVTFNTSGAAIYTLQPGNLIGIPPFMDMPMVTTTYTLTGTNINGCNSTNVSNVQITVKETPTVSVPNGSVCLGQTFQMVPSGASTYIYSSVFSAVTPSTAGQHNYSVVGTSTNGCVSNSAICTVTAVALPIITAIASKTTVCTKQSSSLTASGAATYTWSAGGTNSTSAVIIVNPSIATIYSVTGRTAEGCENSQTVTVGVSSCAGITENSVKNNLRFYPNPAHAEFILELEEPTIIKVYDMLGQLIHAAELPTGSTLINSSTWPSGTYILYGKTDSGSWNSKLIKE